MKKQGRYLTSGLIEDQYMPGSKGKVLRNLLGITTKKEIDRVETELLFEITDQLLDEFDESRRFSADDILQIHRRWLGSVYEWAGTYRQVMMSKGNFMFAAPAYLSKLMVDFEKELLAKYTPCIFKSRQDVIYALAIVHTELILIHPFREGNGRIARLLATLMALQAGLPLLDFSGLEKERQKEYFAAVQNGMNRNYEPMEKIFADIIAYSLQIYDE
jgi:cell filamentation protein